VIREDVLAAFRAWGAEGGKKGGALRWKGVTPEQRREHARKAARARWAKRRKRS
jgi:hypothetical protein